jgi:hypothetical protein
MNEKHSLYGGSVASRWVKCPGSVRLIRANPVTEVPKFVTTEGSFAHFFCELSLKEWVADAKGRDVKFTPERLSQAMGTMKGVKYPNWGGYGFDMTVTEELIEGVFLYCKHVTDTFEKFKLPRNRLMVESHVVAESISEECRGTVDTYFYTDDTLYLYDFKFGAGKIVDPENNYQFAMYMQGVLDKLPKAGDTLKKFVAVCVQPRGHDDIPIKTWEGDVKDLDYFKEDMQKAYKDSVSEEPTLATGDHCGWCPAKAVCPKQTSSMFEICAIDPKEATTPKKLENKINKELLTIDEIEIGRRLALADVVEDYIAKLRAIASDMAITDGKKIPGFKVVKKVSRRTGQWNKSKDESDIEKFLIANLGQDAYEKSILSLKKAAPKLEVKGVKVPKEYEGYTGDGLTLVPESDKRPEHEAIKAFDMIDEDIFKI